MVYDGFCCYFLSTCQVDFQGDLIVYFTMLMPQKNIFVPNLTFSFGKLKKIEK
jgi:hypothetical protein